MSGANSDDYNWTEVCMKNTNPNMMWGLSVHYYTVVNDWTHKGSATTFGEDEYFRGLKKALFMDKLIAQTWKAPQQSGYKGQLQGLVNSLTLKQLLTLAADNTAPESVRSIALLEIDNLKSWMTGSVKSSSGEQKANLLFGLEQISQFDKDPAKFKPAPVLPMPDGSPIGE